MKNFIGEKFKEYWGLVTYTIILAYVIFNFKNIISGGKNIIGIISPFIIGIAIAFILNQTTWPNVQNIEGWLTNIKNQVIPFIPKDKEIK